MTDSNPSVGIVLLSYNRFKTIEKCLLSLKSIIYQNYSVVVVDNHSSDNSAQKIQANFPHVHVIQNDKNSGFCGGNNIGIQYCLQKNFDYILILNDDVEVEHDFLSRLIHSALTMKNNLHVITGKIFFNHNRKLIWYAGGDLSFVHGIGKHRGFFKKEKPEYAISGPVTYASGCMMLVKREVFETIGLLKESIFAYLDDAEFCLRLHVARIPIYYDASVIIFHDVRGGIGLKNYSLLYLYFSTRNRVLISEVIIYKWYMLLYTCIASLVKIIIFCMVPKVENRQKKIIAIVQGLYDAVLIALGLFDYTVPDAQRIKKLGHWKRR